jgi:hypothetical protein
VVDEPFGFTVPFSVPPDVVIDVVGFVVALGADDVAVVVNEFTVP